MPGVLEAAHSTALPKRWPACRQRRHARNAQSNCFCAHHRKRTAENCCCLATFRSAGPVGRDDRLAAGHAGCAVALGEAGMKSIAVGIGCRRGATSASVVSLVRDALLRAALPVASAELFTIDAKRDEPGLVQAAANLGVPLHFISRESLAAIDTPTRSAQSLKAFGVSSVAESAALAGAGKGAILVVGRVAREGVTCAVAAAS